MKIKNMSIRYKLMVPVFGLMLAVLVLIAVGFTSIAKMQRASVTVKEKGVNSLIELNKISVESQKMQKLGTSYCTSGADNKESIWAGVEECNGKLQQSLENMKAYMMGTEQEEKAAEAEAGAAVLYATVSEVKAKIGRAHV